MFIESVSDSDNLGAQHFDSNWPQSQSSEGKSSKASYQPTAYGGRRAPLTFKNLRHRTSSTDSRSTMSQYLSSYGGSSQYGHTVLQMREQSQHRPAKREDQTRPGYATQAGPRIRLYPRFASPPERLTYEYSSAQKHPTDGYPYPRRIPRMDITTPRDILPMHISLLRGIMIPRSIPPMDLSIPRDSKPGDLPITALLTLKDLRKPKTTITRPSQPNCPDAKVAMQAWEKINNLARSTLKSLGSLTKIKHTLYSNSRVYQSA